MEELKGQVIDKFLETGGDRISGYFPVKWTELGDKFGVSGKTAVVCTALDQITVNDTRGFNRETGYIGILTYTELGVL